MYLTLVTLHVVGAILGTGGATFLEIFLNKALADGKMEPIESKFMRLCYTTVRVGMVIGILSGLGFLALYIKNEQWYRLQNPFLWAKIAMLAIIILNAYLLHKKKMNLFWGSSLSFVSWWGLTFSGVFLTNAVQASFITIMFWYIFAIIVGAGILDLIRSKVKARAMASASVTPSPSSPPQNPTPPTKPPQIR